MTRPNPKNWPKKDGELLAVRELIAAVYSEPYIRRLGKATSDDEAVQVLKSLLINIGYSDVTDAFDAAVERIA